MVVQINYSNLYDQSINPLTNRRSLQAKYLVRVEWILVSSIFARLIQCKISLYHVVPSSINFEFLLIRQIDVDNTGLMFRNVTFFILFPVLRWKFFSIRIIPYCVFLFSFLRSYFRILKYTSSSVFTPCVYPLRYR